MFDFQYKAPKVVAEIGCNHKGEFDTAVELIELARLCGANVAKFQKRNPKELLSIEQYNAPHPNQYHSYGQTYGKHREFLEFSQKQHAKLKKHCEKIGIEYSTSVWDLTSAKEIIELNPSFIKVPSACNNNYQILKILRDKYKGMVHISLGMTYHTEEERIIKFFKQRTDPKRRLVLYSCTSGYPVPFEKICLLEINRIYSQYSKKANEIGFSGHHLGIAVDIAAYTLGARWIERHFTKDRTWRGTDHAASLEPPGLQKLVRDLNAVHKSLTFKKGEILDIEKASRDKLKYQGPSK